MTENELFFAKPSLFNDPFDSQFEIQWSDDPEILRMNLERLSQSYNRNLSPGELRIQVEQRLAEILAPGFKEEEAARRTALMDKGYGILCLSETRSNPLMWTHYADNHRGFCVGFDSDGLQRVGNAIFAATEFGSDIWKVRYCQQFPVFRDADPPTPGEMMRVVVTSKAPDWSYEKEYRFVLGLKSDARTWHYVDAALCEVILGCRISPTDEQEIQDVLRRKPARPALFRAVRRQGEYALDFHCVQY